MQDGMRNNILQKILEFIQTLPEAEGLEGEPKAHELSESPELEGAEDKPQSGKLEIMAVSAKPKDALDKMKGC